MSNQVITYDSDNFVKHKRSPLTIREQKFVIKYLETGDEYEAYKLAGFKGSNTVKGVNKLLNKPTVRAEIEQRMELMRKQSIASSIEVMEYFSKVMRGEIKDQFGLDAPLAERTKAAQELVKRTFDLEYKEKQIEEANIAPEISIKLDWGI